MEINEVVVCLRVEVFGGVKDNMSGAGSSL